MNTLEELLYYCKEPEPVGAVLLTGEWGCGKTYLIDNVYSLVVKDSSYDSPDRDLLMEALVNLRDQMEENKTTKLAIPRLCCGRGGLDWDDVKAMIGFVFGDADIQILVCVQ